MRNPHYTCPIKAAIMATHHGMKFTNPKFKMHDWATEVSMPLDKYYVHPDSVGLLEPKIGDILVSIEGNSPAIVVNDLTTDDHDYEVTAHLEHIKFWKPKHKIIFRDNNPFIWPESEWTTLDTM